MAGAVLGEIFHQRFARCIVGRIDPVTVFQILVRGSGPNPIDSSTPVYMADLRYHEDGGDTRKQRHESALESACSSGVTMPVSMLNNYVRKYHVQLFDDKFSADGVDASFEEAVWLTYI